MFDERPRRRWSRYAAEFVVVFLGVSLSFMAESYRESRAERRSERASLERLLRDVEQDLADLPGNLVRANRGVAAVRWLHSAEARPDVSSDSVGYYLSQYLTCSSVNVNSSEYQSLRASGGLNRIRDADFRQHLTANYEQYPTMARVHQTDCDAMMDALYVVADELEIRNEGLAVDVRVVGDPMRVVANRRFQAELSMTAQRRAFLSSLVNDRIDALETLRGEAQRLLEGR